MNLHGKELSPYQWRPFPLSYFLHRGVRATMRNIKPRVSSYRSHSHIVHTRFYKRSSKVAFCIQEREVPSVVEVSKVQFSPFRVFKVANRQLSCL